MNRFICKCSERIGLLSAQLQIHSTKTLCCCCWYCRTKDKIPNEERKKLLRKITFNKVSVQIPRWEKIAIFSLFCPSLPHWRCVDTHSHNVTAKMQSKVIIFVYFLYAVRPISLVTNIPFSHSLLHFCDRFYHLFLFRIPLHLNFPIADRLEK